MQDGPADAPVLVLGPSLGTDTGLFDPQVAELTRTHRVLRYDLRGHGGSELVPGRARSPTSPVTCWRWWTPGGVERFSYAGVPISGAIGRQLALTVPDRLEKLAIIASAAQFADPPSWVVRAGEVREQGTEVLVPSHRHLVHRRVGQGGTGRGGAAAGHAAGHPRRGLRRLL